ncbi:MAG: hypothetical protein HKO53_03235 [Gemmatimonadetes bacterium]|nr:hypothetical protein [Gemmatimonadota bacterium]NNM32049.1 hypothetical protein [Gemmatimonadota bacterium]
MSGSSGPVRYLGFLMRLTVPAEFRREHGEDLLTLSARFITEARRQRGVLPAVGV